MSGEGGRNEEKVVLKSRVNTLFEKQNNLAVTQPRVTLLTLVLDYGLTLLLLQAICS